MATQKQIEANRRNAQLSPGPRSPGGKFRSSLNALKHGAYSKNLLTPDENDVELAKLERIVRCSFSPVFRVGIARRSAVSGSGLETSTLWAHGVTGPRNPWLFTRA